MEAVLAQLDADLESLNALAIKSTPKEAEDACKVLNPLMNKLCQIQFDLETKREKMTSQEPDEASKTTFK